MESLIEGLIRLTPQRPLEEVAAECDIAFSRYPKTIPVEIRQDPFRAALDCSRREKKKCLVVFHRFFTVVYPDARWMRSLRLYEEMSK
jgi:hypothetical protein